MTLPTFTAALATPSKAPIPALVDGALAEAVGTTADAAPGGFAAALDGAAASLEALTAGVLDGVMPALPGVPELPAPPLLATAAAVATTIPTMLPTALATPAVAPAPTSGETSPAAAATPAPGWPPPGLSSLFPATPVLAAHAGAQAAAGALNSVRGAFAALLPDASTAAAADGANSAPVTLLSSTANTSAVPAPAAMPLPAAHAIAPDALAAALARQPAPLRLPVADESDAVALTAITEGLGTERAPDLAPTGLTAPTSTPHKLDLAQAFPAPVPLPSPRFAEEVGARLQWIAEQQGGEATLRISPDGLGPVEIRMKLDGDRVDLGFAAAQQDTRQALQDALPKLREMLAQQGLQLGQADVGQKHAQSSNDEAAKTAKGFAGEDEGESIVLAPQPRESTLVIGRGGRGVLDLYA